jgi:hypothetical protein
MKSDKNIGEEKEVRNALASSLQNRYIGKKTNGVSCFTRNMLL